MNTCLECESTATLQCFHGRWTASGPPGYTRHGPMGTPYRLPSSQTTIIVDKWLSSRPRNCIIAPHRRPHLPHPWTKIKIVMSPKIEANLTQTTNRTRPYKYVKRLQAQRGACRNIRKTAKTCRRQDQSPDNRIAPHAATPGHSRQKTKRN